jgi:hypothetical protein
MNTRTLIALATFALAAGTGSAFAQEAGSDAWMNAQSGKTRAEVLAELKQARADGSIRAASAGYLNPLVGSTTREAVRSQTLAAARSGELARVDAEAWLFDGMPADSATRVAQAAR